MKRWLGLAALLLLSGRSHPQDAAPPKVDFVRDIQPIIKASCHKCHGSEKKPQGQLRLDSRSLALKGGVSGKVIVPGNAKDSLLLKLVLEKDDEARMPQKAPALTGAQIDLLRAWIDQGAAWPDSAAGDGKLEVHWAYVKPSRRVLPAVSNKGWVRNPIDAIVLARLEREGIAPSPEADRATLLKRLHYDLVGLPAEVADVEAFVKDSAPDAYERRVDRLLASPHFGERWGRHWLDKARYADSDGYEKDTARPDAWRYRSWVIDAINADMPFDRFTIEQLAGDLLPGATPLQILATAFNRQTLTNTEGGVDKEQFRVEAVFDRAETTGTVWLGLTVGCAKCHNHKFDQISQQEFYQLFAFFNNGDEVNHETPISDEAMAKYEKEKAAHAKKLRALEEKLDSAKPALVESLPAWEAGIQERLQQDLKEAYRYHPVEVVELKPKNEIVFRKLDDGSYLTEGADPNGDTYRMVARASVGPITGFRVEALAHNTLPKNGPGRAADGGFVLSEFTVAVDGTGPVALHQATADFSEKDRDVKTAIDGNTQTGWGILPQVGKNHHADFLTTAPLTLDANQVLIFTLDQQRGSRYTLGRFKVMAMTGTRPGLELPDDVRRILATQLEKRSAAQKDRLIEHYAAFAPATEKIVKEIEAHKHAAPKPPLMSVRVIAQRGKDRESKMFRRGDFLQPLQPVSPGTLASLHPLKARGATPDRLDLARWLMDPENPITGRVVANHFWANLFGHGLVRTPNDWGVRGERPSHPDLLDWLALELPRLGWSQKQLIRTIVTSSTYRQASRTRPELRDRDPQNYLLARQNRFRVEAEIVRDLALGVSGLLSRKIGGPSVFPPMPADIAALSYANNFKWKNSEGEDRYRRGMYTFFKRTAPYPGLSGFDCPDSNVTCVQRRTSNTPLQALTLLNNEVFIEAAQAFAGSVLAPPLKCDGDRLELAFRRCVSRDPSEAEVSRLRALLAKSRAWYRERPEEAKKLAGKNSPVDEAAAWVAVARILLNLDEFLTRE